MALLIATSVVWLALLAAMYFDATDQRTQDRQVRDFGNGLLSSLAEVRNEDEARAIAAAVSKQVNNLSQMNLVPAVMLIQLRTAHGTTLFSSPEAGGAVLVGNTSKLSNVVVNSKVFRVFVGTSPQWQLVVASAKPDDLGLLMTLGRRLGFYLLVAFPCYLLPIWLAVLRGLQPLLKLSEKIAARSADDLSLINADVKYKELKPLVSALDGLLIRLRSKIAREHAFVQDAAHELRTPMAVISAQAHALAKASTARERVEAEHLLDKAIARAAHLIRQLLQLARIDGEHADASCVVDVALLVRQELAQIGPLAIASKRDLSLDAPDTLFFSLRVHDFQTILHNLVDNALRYVQEGGQVVVTMSGTDKMLTLSVADNGSGIPEGEWIMVFERFYRGGAHDIAGSGLGLAIVKQATTKLNGSVRITPGLEGHGCQFLVEIPAP